MFATAGGAGAAGAPGSGGGSGAALTTGTSPAGVGSGVAVPHARLPGLDRMRGVFIRLEAPVDFDAVDGQPVDLLFALLAPPDAGSEHLRALARVSRLLRQSQLREQLRQARTVDALYALLAQPASPTAA